MQLIYDSIPQPPSSGEDHQEQQQRSNNKMKLIMGVLMGCAVVALLITTSVHITPVHATRPLVSTTLVLTEEKTDAVKHVKGSVHQSSLSSRGQEIKDVRDDIALFTAGAADSFHPTQNRKGYLVMLVAENKLMWSEMAAKMKQVQASQPLPEWIFGYGDMGGQKGFKAAMAKMMQKWIPLPVNPDNLRFQAGAGSVLDCLSWCLADPNDGVLVTAPNYAAFAGDFNMYGRVKLHVAPTKADNGYAPTVEELDECFDRSLASGNPPKIFIICQPNNPTGVIYTAESMHLMITWALSKGLHVVSDEIYALSVFPGQKTTSAAQIMSEINVGKENYLGDKVHIVAGMSKDWGMSGFRVGSLFTHNAQLLHAVDTLGYYQSVSEYTQHALTGVFENGGWVDWYIGENQRRLFTTFEALQEALSLVQVPLFPSQGGLFAWADFSSFLKEGQSEKDLWLELFHKAKVLFTTGESCNAEKPGLFRVVYAWPEGGVEAMRELGQRLVKWKTERE